MSHATASGCYDLYLLCSFSSGLMLQGFMNLSNLLAFMALEPALACVACMACTCLHGLHGLHRRAGYNVWYSDAPIQPFNFCVQYLTVCTNLVGYKCPILFCNCLSIPHVSDLLAVLRTMCPRKTIPSIRNSRLRRVFHIF